MGRRPHRGRDCTPALCCMAFGLGVLLALCGEGRTALRVLRFRWADWLSLALFVVLTAGVITLKKFGF